MDDISVNIDVLKAMLQSRYRVKTALNGDMAIEIATSEDPLDLILLDIMMPGA